MDVLFDAFLEIFRLTNFIAMIAGVIGGIAIGALPGLSATMAISVLIPLTFFMEPLAALGMIAGIYNGAMYGGSIPAVLLRIPGTPAAVATTFDGYPMAQKGQAGWALQIACVSSAVGGMASAIALMTIAPPLSYITLAFGPAEVFWVAVFGLTAIVFLVGEQPVKGLISALFGVVVSLVGTDVITGVDRYTFGRLELLDGLNVVVMLVGLYAIPPMIGLLLDDPGNEAATRVRIERGGLLTRWRDLAAFWLVWLRASVIGIFVGILPGAGGSMAAFLSYNEARRTSRDPDAFGRGEPAGVAAAECGNNADNAAALIPALTLGIPGSSVTAVILGALLVHGLQPGPELFRSHPTVVYGFMIQMFVSSLLLVFLGGTIATCTFARLLEIPRPVLAPIILGMTVVGTFAINGSMFDVALMFGFGFIGYVMERQQIPLAPAVLGLILGEYAERNFRLSMMIGGNDPAALVASPISMGFVAAIALAVGLPLVRRLRKAL
jgi:putative tricarboxylic transport membrane protein